MRLIAAWRQELMHELRPHWPKVSPRIGLSAFCDVELGIFLLQTLFPQSPAQALWTILSGYPFPFPETETWSTTQYQMIGTARHLLPYYKNPHPWKQMLSAYRQVDERLRGFDLSEPDGYMQRRSMTVGAQRWELYAQALGTAPGYKRTPLQWATAGVYEFPASRRWVSVTFPHDLIPTPLGHKHTLTGVATRPAISVVWSDLIHTARWMDAEASARSLPPSSWEDRILRVQLELFDTERTTLHPATELTLDTIVHLIGMVSSGKSTLMDILAVHLARKGSHVTLVVGDVIAALERADCFHRLGLAVAPILGASNRERHMNRLHRSLLATDPENPLHTDHRGFRWLSSACPLDGLCDTPTPLPPGTQPCLRLRPVPSEDDSSDTTFACPFYPVCPFHQAQRDLLHARIWIATPASLIYTPVAAQINAEQIRVAELVYRRSDLVIFDEADRVQTQLDLIFSPNQTLVSRSADAWLGQMSQQVSLQLSQKGRGQLADERVAAWCQAHDTAQMAANRVYALLLQNSMLRAAITQDYFTAWTLLEGVAGDMSGARPEQRDHHPTYTHLMHTFETFVDDPLGERANTLFTDLARQTLTTTADDPIQTQIATWVTCHADASVNVADRCSALTTRILLALCVAVLSNRIDHLLREWRYVEIPLHLEGKIPIFFHRPPEDYASVIPAAPMGNVLAFQYRRSHNHDPDDPGELHFFRCMGVGRWILLHFHELFASDGIAGPHVLLLSGTSWAGTSPNYDLQVPVAGVLRAPPGEIAAIAQSTFRFTPTRDRTGQPVRVSGRQGEQRRVALATILQHLARQGGLGGPSRLEVERDRLPIGRQRILLLVGSYAEADHARIVLEQTRPDWRGQVLHLISDDAEFVGTWNNASTGLRRGMVHHFAQTDAWILIAPLLAVERGHNILNDQQQAAIGAAYFLVRPHPRPDDIGHAIHAINRWAVLHYNNQEWLKQVCDGDICPKPVGEMFRAYAYRQWRYLLKLPVIYSTLPDAERDTLAWNQLVTIWQVIGRLVRGGVPARVSFCDAAFAQRAASHADEPDHTATSLLIGMRDVLRPFFDPDSQTPSHADRLLAETLYGPLYTALTTMGGLFDAQV